MARYFWVVFLSLAAACGGSEGSPTDGGTGGVGGAGGGVGGSMGTGATGGLPLACDELPALGGELGGQCRGDTFECNGNLTCLGEQSTTIGL